MTRLMNRCPARAGVRAPNSMLDAFVHIDAEQTTYVYDWRLQQEAALRASKGTGMTDEQVIHFVNGCKFAQTPTLLPTRQNVRLSYGTKITPPTSSTRTGCAPASSMAKRAASCASSSARTGVSRASRSCREGEQGMCY